MAKTIRYKDDGKIELFEKVVPDPGPGEVQVQGGACGICSWDIATAKYGRQFKPMAPPGHEGVGYVVKVGSEIRNLREGDRVAGGGFSTKRNLLESRVRKIPQSDLPDEYWIVEPVSCIVTGIDHCRIKPGDRIALIGCGFMGQLLLQVLIRSPLDSLVAIDVIRSRLDLAEDIGVAEVYEADQVDPVELHDRGFDVVIDTSGSQDGLSLATDIVRPGGLINLFGWIKGKKANFDPTKWHLGGFTVVNSSPTAKTRETFGPAIRLIQKGIIRLKPLVTHTSTLDDYPVLMEKIVSGDKSYVKGVVLLS
ncbi:MAG: putative zinc-type alcohol dehydrogenase-like protein YdjJ [Candidatus Moanabacter tarae]|uniref:Putative zinc-type alcohol dehydrogenase-like protein YdjJ n=1 Tax=Candidatus Moanibacter tarae TaxID=2200854 RepID=A0A2Z4AGL2_9BACT|nr:MAG: putative zinc-type alcohol dehydrogenase-like protein YdjJ [Candidatus Moanabacter tarae]|tara:strand:- start:4105 stop:5028 length:924 start_codon:yes stop_codon:yes gene_type:complete